MIDQDKPMIFMDSKCPNCGSACGNGGSSDIFHCCWCGWSGHIGIHPDDIKAIEEIMRRHQERNKEAAHD